MIHWPFSSWQVPVTDTRNLPVCGTRNWCVCVCVCVCVCECYGLNKYYWESLVFNWMLPLKILTEKVPDISEKHLLSKMLEQYTYSTVQIITSQIYCTWWRVSNTVNVLNFSRFIPSLAPLIILPVTLLPLLVGNTFIFRRNNLCWKAQK